MWNIEVEIVNRQDAKTPGREQRKDQIVLIFCLSWRLGVLAVHLFVFDSSVLHRHGAAAALSDARQQPDPARNIVRSLKPRLVPARLGVAKLRRVLSAHAGLSVDVAAEYADRRATRDDGEPVF